MSVTLQHFLKAMDEERGQDYCTVNIQRQALKHFLKIKYEKTRIKQGKSHEAPEE